jgi:murein L,D-transpeptidase YafK
MRLRNVFGMALGVALAPLTAHASSGGAAVVGNAFFDNAPEQTMVLVEKEDRVAYLVRNDGDQPRVLEHYNRILLGENGGDKVVEGDKRTPEGVYFIQRYIPAGELLPRYGDGAFPINYPNIVDRIEDKTGYGIWLHGVNEADEDKRATQGCVAFNNGNLNALKRVLDIGTPVVITKQAEFLSPAAYRERKQRLMGNLNAFLEAWESNDFQALKRLVHPQFRNSTGQDAAEYLAEKRQLMQAFPERRVEANHVRVFKENGHRVVYDFDQFYCAANVAAYGRKRLYFKRGNGRPQLMAAEYFAKPSWPLIYERVREFVQGWQRSWEEEDLDGYMAHYARDFRHHGRDRAGWRAYKAGVFERREDMQVGVDNLWIRQLAGNRYVVGYDQRFTSAGYDDYGVKTLVLDGCPGAFRIAAEYWRPLP